ncbi:putative bifunctional diguanylate cyclase/phosphodiesterase [Piscinibacter terrae]|nr:GGDEF and EAL domain-containing protein [Albitalea terrae]
MQSEGAPSPGGRTPRESLVVLLVFGVPAAVIVAAGLVGVLRRVSDVRAQQADAMRAVIGLKTVGWRLWLEERHNDVQGLHADADLLLQLREWVQTPSDGARVALKARLRLLRQTMQCADILLIDQQGRPLIHAADGPVVPNEKLPGLATLAVTQMQTVHGDVFASTTSAGPATAFLDMLVPLPGEVLSGVPVLVMRFDAGRSIERLMHSWQGSSGEARFTMFRADADTVHALQATRRDGSAVELSLVPLARSSHWLAAAARGDQGARSLVEGTDSSGEAMLGLAAELPESGWMLGVSVASGAVYASTWGDAAWIALADLFALVLAGGAARAVLQHRELRSERRERAEQEEKLRALGLLDAIANGTSDAVYAKDRQGRYIYLNRFACLMLKRPLEDLLGRDDFALFAHEPAALMVETDRQVLATGQPQSREDQLKVDGELHSYHTVKAPLRGPDGSVIGVFGISRDITDLKRSQARLDRLAHYDELTGLPNRSLVGLRLEHALEHSRRAKSRTAILSIDIDGFKTINDSLGHPAGDEMLCVLAQRLRARLREEDTLGRLGGDEFLVVIEGLSEPGEAAVVARDVLQAVARPVPLSNGSEAYVTASIGISVYPDDGCANAMEMLRDADAALYRAKEEGRNGFCFYTRDLNTDAKAKLELEAALSHALERDEFVLHYQPQVDARTGRMAGVEALLRWNRRGAGMVSPGQFIPLAERSGLIVAIGNWVIEAACRQIRTWLDAGVKPPRVAVNVSARQFAEGDLDVVLRGAMRRHRVPAALIEVELTESMLVHDPDKTEILLSRLKALGIRLSLDDFGTGYSSLGYLQRFPIDTLKIDQSFIRRIGTQPDGGALADAVIALAHRLNLRVIAEGVETPQQHQHLLDQGCDEIQGYLFGKPMPAPDLLERLAGGACSISGNVGTDDMHAAGPAAATAIAV